MMLTRVLLPTPRLTRPILLVASLLLALGALLGLATLLRLPAVAHAQAPAAVYRLDGRLLLNDPLAHDAPASAHYTLTAHIAGQIAATWTITSGAPLTPTWSLTVAATLTDSRPITFSVVDAAGVRGRVAQTATVGIPVSDTLDLTLDFRPNILVLVTDDQRADQMIALPETQSRIFDAGVAFNRAYQSQSLCCPARASLYSGLYAHNSGVFHNQDYAPRPTYPAILHDAGYYTGQIGKYTNAWFFEYEHAPRPEFDFWTDHPYYTYRNAAGLIPFAPGTTRYGTDVVRDYALYFFDQAAQRGDRPFLLVVNYIAPHTPAIPDAQDAGLFLDLPPQRPPSFNPDGGVMAEKPALYRDLSPLSAAQIADLDALRIRMLQTLASVDRSNAAMLDRLAADGLLENTVVVYLSDNGYHLGEHRLTEKNTPYEEATRVPLAIRYDRLVNAPRVADNVVANVDLLPTLVGLAGAELPPVYDGVSLLPLLAAPAGAITPTGTLSAAIPTAPGDVLPADPLLADRAYIVLHGLNAATDYVGIHSGRFVYVEHFGQRSELYDLANDPYQLDNLIGDAAYSVVQARLAQQLAAERASWGPRVQLYGGAFDHAPGIDWAGTLRPYIAAVWPQTVTLPLTFTWQADEQPTVSHTVNGYSDTVDWLWAQGGLKAVTVTVSAPGMTPVSRTTAVQMYDNVAPKLTLRTQALTFVEGTLATVRGGYNDQAGDAVTVVADAGTLTQLPLNGQPNVGGWVWRGLLPAGPDAYTLTLTATDRLSLTTRLLVTLQLTNAPPTIALDAPPPPVQVGQIVTLSGRFSDLGTQPVTVTAAFGDVTQTPGASGVWTWTQRMPIDAPPQQVITLTATDADGAQAVVTTTLRVTPRPPDNYYISTATNGRVNDLPYSDEDILAYDPVLDVWYMLFDGSDVGLAATDVVNFEFLADNSLLLTVEGNVTLPDVGPITPHDIVRFVPTSLGEVTAGSFALVERGGDVGRDTAGERLDALLVQPDGTRVFSTVRSNRLSGAWLYDEDLIGPAAAQGGLALWFDGSDVGLAADDNHDLNAAAYDGATGWLFITTVGAYALPGLSGDANDVLLCAAEMPAADPTCDWRLAWDPTAHGLAAGVQVDALAVRPRGEVFLLSSAKNGFVGGLYVADEDIVGYAADTGVWFMLLDGSDIGLAAANVSALATTADGDWLIGVAWAATVDPLGTVAPNDLLRVTTTQVGRTTVGTLTRVLTGTAIGLSGASANIDALADLPNGDLLLSTVGSVSLAGQAGAWTALDEDLVRYSAAGGLFDLWFDGSDVGLAGDPLLDVTSAWYDAAGGALYLTLLGDGHRVLRCSDLQSGALTRCTLTPYWDAAAAGLPAGQPIDALTISR